MVRIAKDNARPVGAENLLRRNGRIRQDARGAPGFAPLATGGDIRRRAPPGRNLDADDQGRLLDRVGFRGRRSKALPCAMSGVRTRPGAQMGRRSMGEIGRRRAPPRERLLPLPERQRVLVVGRDAKARDPHGRGRRRRVDCGETVSRPCELSPLRALLALSHAPPDRPIVPRQKGGERSPNLHKRLARRNLGRGGGGARGRRPRATRDPIRGRGAGGRWRPDGRRRYAARPPRGRGRRLGAGRRILERRLPGFLGRSPRVGGVGSAFRVSRSAIPARDGRGNENLGDVRRHGRRRRAHAIRI